MGVISIRGLEVYAAHGCLAQERSMGQRFLINVDMHLDLYKSALNDDLEQTVNYSEVCDKLTEWMQEDSYNLIETVADILAEKLLLQYPQIKKVSLELEKPQAPIKAHFDTVMVKTERMRHSVYLGLGSNLGERKENIEKALEMLSKRDDCSLKECSPFYESEAYGFTEQPDFINACAHIETTLEPHQLLTVLQSIEDRMGRIRGLRWGPRVIDLDILFFDDYVIDTRDLHVPHIDIKNRVFVLKPLSDIAGFLRHPYLNRSVQQMLDDIGEKDVFELFKVRELKK